MTDLNAMAAELARLKAENEALKASKARSAKITFKVGAKGGISAYGLGRFPVTLYVEQWERLLAATDQLKVFIEDNRALLAVKGSTSNEG